MYIAVKIMVFLLMFAILFVLKEGMEFFINLRMENGRYKPGTKRLIILGICISYILTIIFTGFKLF